MNPLRLDPTRTTLLRQQLELEFVARFQAIMKDVIRLVVKEDVFGLGVIGNSLTYNTSFEKWLEENVNKRILNKTDKGFWVDDYVKKSYEKGVERSYSAIRKGFKDKVTADASMQEFKKVFSGTAKVKLKTIHEKTFSDLKGITKEMSGQISAIISEGLMKGKSADQIGAMINDRISKIGLTRAKTLARTEIVRANAEGILDTMESLGVNEVQVMVEWATAKNPCKLCMSLAGITMTVKEARGLFPRHPNCLCSPIPSTQKTRRPSLIKRISESIVEEGKSNWSGSNLLRKLKRK